MKKMLMYDKYDDTYREVVDVKELKCWIEIKRKEIDEVGLYNMEIPNLVTLHERLGAKIGIKYFLQSFIEELKEERKKYPIAMNDEQYKKVIELAQKEIEELKDMNERQKYRIELVSEDKIEERGDSIDESTMLKQIKSKLDEKNIPIETLLAEFERLENLEDDLTIVYLNGVYDGEKKVEDKIKAKIEKAKKNYNDLHTKHLRDCGIAEQRELAKIEFGQSLLEKE